MRRGLLLVAALVASLVGASQAAAVIDAKAKPIVVEKSPVLPARVTDVEGKTVTIRNVSRIVPLNGDIAETVFTLGLTSRVVGVDTSALYPKSAVDPLPKIGYQRTLSAEGILSLRPTIVIGSTEAGPPTVIQQLRAAGVTVLIIPEIVALNAAPRKLRLLGRALGVPKRGEKLARQVEGQIATARREASRTTGRPRAAFLYLRGSAVQMLGGRNTRADTMITAAGGIDTGSELGIEGFRPITAESLVAARPDVIVVPSAGLASVGGIEGMLRIPGVAQTPAGRARRVLAYDDALLLGLGPRTGSALRRLVRGLHPEIR
jgi:heme transport system substrate-binding protein